MDKHHRDKYAELMLEISRRVSAVEDFSSGKCATTYVRTTTESAYLQFRKVLELIAFSSLVSHRQSYSAVREQFRRDWHAERILKKVEALNPNFYPKPVSRVDSNGFSRPRGGYLTRHQLQKLYDRCGSVLHSRNPFQRNQDFESISNQIPIQLERIKNLIGNHTTQLIDSDELLLVTVPFGRDSEPVHVVHLVKTKP